MSKIEDARKLLLQAADALKEGSDPDDGISKAGRKRMQSLSLTLTDEQKSAIADFWKETGSVGTVEIQVDVVNDKISPASIQVGTAK